MHITLTGKPFAGKGETSKIFEKLGFEVVHMGELYREVAKERGLDVLELNKLGDVTVDDMVDKKLIEIAKEKKDEEIVFDSRIAWHFLPDSFKVFLDVEAHVQAKRIMGAKRDSEKTNLTFEEALESAKQRWNLENGRYQKLYHIDNLNKSNYDLVIDTTQNTPRENATQILKEFYGGEKEGVFEDGEAVFQKICSRHLEKRDYEKKVEARKF